MPNVNSPYGLIPIRSGSGQAYAGRINRYFVDSGYGTALFCGDPVVLSGGGDADGVAGVERAAAGNGNPIAGVIVSVQPDPDNLTRRYIPASTGGYVYVMDDPDAEFEIQEDSVAGALDQTDIGGNCNLIAGAGNISTGLSGFQLDSSEIDTAADDQVQVTRLIQRADNEIGVNAKWAVKINLHQLRQGRTGL